MTPFLNSRRTIAQGLIALVLIAGSVSVARAELLYYQTKRNAGTTRYQSDGNLHFAEFDVYEPIRIEAISGWFQNYDLDVTVDVSEFDVEFGLRGVGYIRDPKVPNPPPPALSLPGRWATLGGLKWDLQPGHFAVGFGNAGMPMTFSSYSEFPDAAGFTRFVNIYDREDGSREFGGEQGFGVKIYGQPLSAVPEPAVYGGMGGLMLVVVAMIRKQKLILKSSRESSVRLEA
jgi:hypothetical protein